MMSKEQVIIGNYISSHEVHELARTCINMAKAYEAIEEAVRIAVAEAINAEPEDHLDIW